MNDNVIKVCDHFWRIEEGGVRMFLFEGEQQAMLIDTGFGGLPVRQIVSELTDLPVMLVITHADGDHLGANRDFSPVYMHPSEMDRYRQNLPEGCSATDVLPLWEGDVIDLGYWRFEVLLTPGHTPGSIMLLEREKRMLISGDTIQNGGIFLFGEGRNLPAFMATLKRLEGMKDAFDTIWPAHADCPIGPEIISGIIEDTKDLIAGKLDPQEPEWPMPAKMFRGKVAGFCYSPDEWPWFGGK